MPSSITHSFFSMDVYQKLNPNIKKLLQPYQEYLKTFGEGPDVLYFYRYGRSGKAKKIRELATTAHRYDTRSFYINLITYIKTKHLEKNGEVLAFLYGYMTHYVLDSTMHPFVNSFGASIKDKNLRKESHTEVERFFDGYMIEERLGMKTKDYKVFEDCFNIKTMSKELINTINNAYEKTYKIKNIGSIYLDSVKEIKLYFWLFRYDPYGIKKSFYRILDRITPKNFLKTKHFSYFIMIDKNHLYLNKNRTTWCHPKDKTLCFKSSFHDLYQEALKKAVWMIEEVALVLYNKKDMDSLNHIFLNISYSTGLTCHSYRNKKLDPHE